MVSSTVVENGKSSPTMETSVTTAAAGIGPGDYRLVGWDMDATGKKLIDEICQIAGYTASSSYSQYVMPHKDLNPTAIKRHNMRIVTMGKYRMLKDNKANKILKTKSEVSALTDFLTWLESVKGDAADGVILVYHEPRKVIPAMLLESLKRYSLLERFKQTVKGFLNGFTVAELKCANTVHTYSLRTLSRTLLNQEKPLDNARDRACLALQIVQHLSGLDGTVKTGEPSNTGSGDSDAAMKQTVEFIREFVQPVDVEEQEYAELKVIFERQKSLSPIFFVLFRVNRRERQHASPLRRLLAEAGIEYAQLQEAWTSGQKDGLEKLIKERVTGAEEKKLADLLTLLEDYFDPEKKPTRTRFPYNRKDAKPETAKINADKENNNNNNNTNEKSDTSATECTEEITAISSPLKVKTECPENNALAVAEE